VRKKGVGYASDKLGLNQIWDINKYAQSKKDKVEVLQGLIMILKDFLDSK